jgi:hypothetical protein
MLYVSVTGVKDKEWSRTHPNKTSCQMLMMAEHSWFQEATTVEADYRVGGPTPERTAAYAKLKEQWKESALEILFLYFPKVRSALYGVGETNSVTAVVQLSLGAADAAVALLLLSLTGNTLSSSLWYRHAARWRWLTSVPRRPSNIGSPPTKVRSVNNFER